MRNPTWRLVAVKVHAVRDAECGMLAVRRGWVPSVLRHGIYPSSAVVEHVGMCCSTFAFCMVRGVYCRCNDPPSCGMVRVACFLVHVACCSLPVPQLSCDSLYGMLLVRCSVGRRAGFEVAKRWCDALVRSPLSEAG